MLCMGDSLNDGFCWELVWNGMELDLGAGSLVDAGMPFNKHVCSWCWYSTTVNEIVDILAKPAGVIAYNLISELKLV